MSAMSFIKLIAFDRPLVGAIVPGTASRTLTESEIEAIRAEAYRQGADSARSFGDQQMVEFRHEVQSLQEGIFGKLTSVEEALLGELRAALPVLAGEIARRLFAGFEPAPEIVERLCLEALEEVCPERDNLELVVSPRDAALLENIIPGWGERYPNLRVRSDATLSPGDCQVRSRFGLTDARRATKLASLTHSLCA
jgi:flagellar assembly protein FliH